MVACCSPSSKYSEETLSTLQYASRAKNIRNSPMVQLDPHQRLIMQLRQEIAALKLENASLRAGQGLPPALTPKPRSNLAYALMPPPVPSARHAVSSPGSLPDNQTGSFAGSPRISYSNSPRGDAVPPFDKAVGYAEGYAAGLDQVREVLCSRGLSLGGSLSAYDLSAGEDSNGVPRKGSVPRLNTMYSRPGSKGGQPGGLVEIAGMVSDQQTAENARLKAHSLKLEQDRLSLEHKCVAPRLRWHE